VKIYHSDRFTFPLPEGHRFPMPKYSLLHQRVIASGLIPPIELIEGEPASDEQLLRAHTPEYLHKVTHGLLSEKEVRRIGLPWSPQLVERSRRSVGCTIAACRAALEDGLAANLAGGTHHAYPDHGEGYCVFNDVAVAARTTQAEGRARRIVIIDCDVHQGNGTAAIFAGDPTVFTFSIHGEKNFPYHKEVSDLDIALPDGTGDLAYLDALESGLNQSLQAARFDLTIYLAGADPFAGDRLGRLSLSKAGLLERDRMVFNACTHLGLPIAITMAGGYAKDFGDIADIHFNTLRLALEFSQNGTSPTLQDGGKNAKI
jgi:acetoin utilization deacetylase AcuC-like enzyme